MKKNMKIENNSKTQHFIYKTYYSTIMEKSIGSSVIINFVDD